MHEYHNGKKKRAQEEPDSKVIEGATSTATLIGTDATNSRSLSISIRDVLILGVGVGGGVVLNPIATLYSEGFLASDLYFPEKSP